MMTIITDIMIDGHTNVCDFSAIGDVVVEKIPVVATANVFATC